MNRLRGCYAILDRNSDKLARSLVDPGEGAATVLQLRIKPDSPVSARDLLDAARMARQITREAGALFIVNDRLDLALAADADGVHLGQDDLPLADARRVLRELGRELIVGISTHDADQVRAATGGGADYIGYGPVYATGSKRNPDPVQGPEALARAVDLAADVPVVAIGGITPARAAEVAAAGAACACAIGAVNDSDDPAAAARRIGEAFTSGSTSGSSRVS